MKTHLIIAYLLTAGLMLPLCRQATAQETAPSAVEKKKKHKQFDPSTAIFFTPVYTAQFPYGNMGDRFGFNNLFGFQLAYKMKKNWLIGAEGNFLYGNKLRENYVLDNISTTTGQFISQKNELVNIRAQEVGTSLKLIVGKIIPFSEKYPDAGIMLQTGLGYLQHKIGINVRADDLPQLDKTYRKGYDRLSSGPVLSQFVGGVFLTRKQFFAGYVGFQFDVGFTENRRPYDFYLKQKLAEKRVDMFLGIRIGWIIPYFLQTSDKEYYYY